MFPARKNGEWGVCVCWGGGTSRPPGYEPLCRVYWLGINTSKYQCTTVIALSLLQLSMCSGIELIKTTQDIHVLTMLDGFPLLLSDPFIFKLNSRHDKEQSCGLSSSSEVKIGQLVFWHNACFRSICRRKKLKNNFDQKRKFRILDRYSTIRNLGKYRITLQDI